MKRLSVGLVLGLGFASNAMAGVVGFSTIRITWSSAGAAAPGGAAAPIPTLGTYGAILLAILLALVVFRVSRNRDTWVRAVAPVVTFGLAVSALFVAQSPIAGLATPPINADGCNGSAVYTADGPNPPPCYVPNCSSPVTINYEVLAAEDPFGDPISPENCTYDYYCGGPQDGTAFDGATIPGDAGPHATAYCLEIFPPEED